MEKKSNFSIRIKEALQAKNMRQIELCSLTNIPKSAMSQYLKGTFEPKQDRLEKIADVLEVNETWLMGYNVPMAVISSDAAEKWIEKYSISMKKSYPVPILGKIRAGLPIIAEENIDGWELAQVSTPEDYFFLRVEGDSMIGAGILDGSLALIHKQNYAVDGQIVAILVDGESATLKRFKRQGNMVILIPENPKYDPIILTNQQFDTNQAQIMGVLQEVKIKFN